MKSKADETYSASIEAIHLDASQWQHPQRDPNDFIGGYEPLLSCWEAIDGRGRLIISRDGELLAHSAGATRFFVQNDPLSITFNQTLACGASSAKQLKKLLSAKMGVVETVVQPKRSGDGHYVISAVGISEAAVAIAVREADESFVTVLADLEEVFGLTRCEALVIERLMRGYRAQRIADDLVVSVHTVRAHLRHCYDKLGVNSREGLWQRLTPYRVN